MKPPPLLTGAALMFWGFETEWFLAALAMAVAIEGSRWVKARWEFNDIDLYRIWDLCAALFVAALFVRYAAGQTESASAYLFFQWFPLIFFPVAIAQVYGQREQFPVAMFSWLLRKRRLTSGQAQLTMHTGFPYVALCLISAGAANRRDLWFLAGLSFLLGWTLWIARPKTFSSRAWVAAFTSVLAIGLAGQAGLTRAQNLFEGKISAWVSGLTAGFDANEARTAIGTVGMRKQSGRIVLRVQAENGPPPALLRAASYDSFHKTAWVASRGAFVQVSPDLDASTWWLQAPTTHAASATIFTSIERAGLLPLPLNAAKIENLPVATLETNGLGAAHVMEAPGLVGYRIRCASSSSFDRPPEFSVDWQVPSRESAVLARIAAQLSLDSMSDAEKIQAIAAYFEKNFAYASYVPANRGEPDDTISPLSRFLLQTKKGHCEYFATATALLLRAAGIPARYVTGYSVQERVGKTSVYVVRERHAHAWTLVWRDGRWEDLDTTPSGWLDEETKRASIFELLSDYWSGLRFGFLKWRWLGGSQSLRQVQPWIIGSLVLFASWRLFRKRSRMRPHSQNGILSSTKPRAGDSELYLIEAHLATRAGDRPRGEPIGHWLENLPARIVAERHHPDLRPLIRLHYRHRFDPAGLTPAERAALRDGVSRWLRGERATLD